MNRTLECLIGSLAFCGGMLLQNITGRGDVPNTTALTQAQIGSDVFYGRVVAGHIDGIAHLADFKSRRQVVKIEVDVGARDGR